MEAALAMKHDYPSSEALSNPFCSSVLKNLKRTEMTLFWERDNSSFNYFSIPDLWLFIGTMGLLNIFLMILSRKTKKHFNTSLAD